MRCAICGLQVDSIDDAIEEGWTPYFYEGTELHDVACPSCTETLLRLGEHGEMEVKEEYRGRLRYQGEIGDRVWQDRSEVAMLVLENEPGKAELGYHLRFSQWTSAEAAAMDGFSYGPLRASAPLHLHEKNGFRLVEQHKGSQWGREVNEQRFELELP